MFLKKKKDISNLIDTINEMIHVLPNLSNPYNGITDCLYALEAIEREISAEKRIPHKTVNYLYTLYDNFNDIVNSNAIISEDLASQLKNCVDTFKLSFWEEVETKLNIVFLPYKASMWDSLASIYDAAVKDLNCVVNVVPIPYYQILGDRVLPTYEGDQFPKNIPIKHYSQYNLEVEQPDIIFVHNIYDNYNTLTQVYEPYFTSNLKKYTDMLVFVPYHISTFIIPPDDRKFLAYSTPSIKNVDRIIVVNQHVKERAIKDGVPEHKLLVLGSPKIDAIVNTLNEDIDYPEEWKDYLEGNTVYLINTGCFFFVNQPFLNFERLTDFFNIPRFVENSIVIWRPHPLTETAIMKYLPSFIDYYRNLKDKIVNRDSLYSGVIFDETSDYIPALIAADVLISADGSLLHSYLSTEKKVLYFGEDMPEGSMLPPDVFYYAFNKEEPWFELVKKFSNGYDPLVENRKNMSSRVYTNADGTSGLKIFEEIKNTVLEN